MLSYSQERRRIVAENASDTIYEWDLRTGNVDVSGLVQDRLGDLPMPRSYEAWKNILIAVNGKMRMRRSVSAVEPSSSPKWVDETGL